MKYIFTIILLSIITGANAQVIIGNATGTAANKTSVLLEFAANQNKGIIVPYVRTLPIAAPANRGTILLNAATPTDGRVLYSDGIVWIDISGQGGNVTSALSDQPSAIVAPESAATKTIISDIPNVNPTTLPQGALVLESNTKAMVLPIVADVQNIINPSPGMLVYVNKTGSKRLAVFNGERWSFWKP